MLVIMISKSGKCALVQKFQLKHKGSWCVFSPIKLMTYLVDRIFR